LPGEVSLIPVKTKMLVLFCLVGVAFAAAPTKCPFVNSGNGLPCLGVPIPSGSTVAGQSWRCSRGHKWIQ